VRQFLAHIGSAAVAAGWLCSPAMADDTRFKIEQITIPGGSEIQVWGINKEGTIVGGYGSSAGYLPFILSGTTVTTLPPPVTPCPGNYCEAVATAINDAGDVVGQATAASYPQGFLWHNGAYVPAGAFRMANSGAVGVGPGISNKGKEFFDYIISPGTTEPYAGRPATIAEIKLPGPYTYVSGMNNHGVLAGQFAASPTTEEVFFGKNGKYTSVLPPNAVSAYFAQINDLDAISGTYMDSAGAEHAFVYEGGAYQVIPLPSGATNILAASINNEGRVVGTYQVPTTNVEVVFLYNGITVSVVTDSLDAIGPLISDHGVIIFNGLSQSEGLQAYRARCAGSGC
jgi:probable HAF family extracellular repeat protein